jgi:hypothetical protein
VVAGVATHIENRASDFEEPDEEQKKAAGVQNLGSFLGVNVPCNPLVCEHVVKLSLQRQWNLCTGFEKTGVLIVD